MKRTSAFTLIEVMVVLSILAIIAILAYNFFGSTMKEAKVKQAATKIYNDMQALEDAATLYYMKNGSWPPSGSGSELVTAGILKALPSADPSAYDGSQPYAFESTWDMERGTAAAEYIIKYWSTTSDICAAYNGMFTSLGEMVWNWALDGPNAYPTTDSHFCTSDGDISVYRFLEEN